MKRPVPDRLVYAACRVVVTLLATLLYRHRVYGASNVPLEGAALLVANHQSHLDPPIIAVSTPRTQWILARVGLFRNRFFGWLIRTLMALPIDESAGDIRAIRQATEKLEMGEALCLFPEGSRSPDGAMRPFKRGAVLLIRRSRCPIVPVAVEGCFDAFPRGARLPRLFGQRTGVMFGRPIAHDDLMREGADAALERLEREVDALRLELRARLRSGSGGRAPRRGPGDAPLARGAGAG